MGTEGVRGQCLLAWTTKRCRARWCCGGLRPDESRGQLDDVEVDGVNWRGSAGSDRRDAEYRMLCGVERQMGSGKSVYVDERC